jgi:hypothetical protein
MARHGTLTMYRNGCTDGPGGRACQPCRNASAAQKRRLRARDPNAQTGAQGVPKVVGLPTRSEPVEAVGPVEAATLAQCAASSTAPDKAGIVASAVALARLIDNPDYSAQLGQNVTRLQKLLESLGKPKRKMSNHLVAISQMAGRRSAIS